MEDNDIVFDDLAVVDEDTPSYTFSDSLAKKEESESSEYGYTSDNLFSGMVEFLSNNSVPDLLEIVTEAIRRNEGMR